MINEPQQQAIRARIRWNDLDANGHVNQALYLTLLEEILDEWFRRRLGLQDGTIADYVVARTTIEYRSELRLEDRYAVGDVRIAALGTTSITVRTRMAASSDSRTAADVESVLVMTDGRGGRPRPLTELERAALGG